MRDFTNKEQVSIYVETLFQLARDARRDNNKEALAFVMGHLVGLVPSSALDGFMSEVDASIRAQRPRKSNGNGSLVKNPVPDKPLSPAGFAER